MKIFFASAFSFLLLLSTEVQAQQLLTSSSSKADTISFRLTSFNNIVLKAVLNEVDRDVYKRQVLLMAIARGEVRIGNRRR